MVAFGTGMARKKERPRVGVSACLLGRRVRWDGDHKRASPVVRLASRFVLVPVCPEVELGLGVPREPIQIERGRGLRLVSIGSRVDLTLAMTMWSDAKVEELRALGISGYVLKSKSPSCGLVTTKIFRGDEVVGLGSGLFAAALTKAFPDLPVVEDPDLEDAAVLRDFIARVTAYARAS
jgi:uncharacterized protein YbbK (DUF523 family)